MFPGLPSSALNDRFEQLGFETMYFHYNLGSLLIAFLALPLQLAVYVCLIPLRPRVPRVEVWMRKMWISVFWNQTISTIVESYVILVICVALNCLSVSSLGLIFSSLTINLAKCSALASQFCSGRLLLCSPFLPAP
jgi:hypothetical protein